MNRISLALLPDLQGAPAPGTPRSWSMASTLAKIALLSATVRTNSTDANASRTYFISIHSLLTWRRNGTWSLHGCYTVTAAAGVGVRGREGAAHLWPLSLGNPRFFPYSASSDLLAGMFTTSCLNIGCFTVYLSVLSGLASLPHMCSTSTCTVQFCPLFSSLLFCHHLVPLL